MILRRPTADQLPHRTLTALIVVSLVVLVPHLVRAPLWLSAAVAGLLGLRYWISRRGWHLPPTLVTLVAAAAATAAVGAHYGTILGRDAGVALLVLMSCLKLLETRSRRDTMIVVFLGYFIMFTHFLFDQSLVTAGYMLVAGWATTSVLIAVSHRGNARLGVAEARQGVSVILQGLPVMALLFVLFPRLPGPLWGLPDDAHGGVTGISDTMAPGDITQLSRSDDVAFRVRFDEEVPAPEERYWRGIVMADYDGETWSRTDVDAGPRRVDRRADPINYTVTIEPHNARWLFVLDLPAHNPDRGSLSFFHERRSEDPVREAERYTARSYTEYRLQPTLSDRERRHYIRLPDNAHPQAKARAQSWRNEAPNDRAVVERALGFFRDQPFEYTLSPDPLPGDRVDDFLFDTRSGFCEHYAGAFAVLMRAAGIPARVVTGYQGAEQAASGDYWTVRQSDAHAWTEVWLPGDGWRRVDPTAAVSPERIEQGLGASVPESDSDAVPTMARGADESLLRRVERTWDLVDATWTSWVISYGSSRQASFLRSIGLADTLRLVLVLAGCITGFMAILGIIAIRQQMGARSRDPASRLWQETQRLLAKRGVPCRPGEGPRDYAERVAREAPPLAAAIRDAARHYIRLRYYPSPEPEDLARLRAAVKRLRRTR